MKADIFDIEKFIEINDCPQVTNPVMFDQGSQPTPDGLFSYELFGTPSSYDRKTIFGYIDLNNKFLHPVVYRAVTSMNRKIKDLIAGKKMFKVEDGELVEAEEGEPQSGTGIKFLYTKWYSLNFEKSESAKRNAKIEMIKELKRDEAFISSHLVLPAFYRDVNMSQEDFGRIGMDEINSMYARLLNYSSSLDDNNSFFDYPNNSTKNRIQQTINEIYDYMLNTLGKKKGYIKDKLMSKSIDHATSSVISASNYSTESWEDQETLFRYTGVPLAQLIVLFRPFFVREVKNFMEGMLQGKTQIGVPANKEEDNDEKVFYELDNPLKQFTPKKIKKMLDLFIESPNKRFSRIKLNIINDDGEEKEIPTRFYHNNLGRDFTLTDLIYIAAKRIVKDKHVYLTRFPVNNIAV